jgi:prolipoprotein diacylglyceryltransferase
LYKDRSQIKIKPLLLQRMTPTHNSIIYRTLPIKTNLTLKKIKCNFRKNTGMNAITIEIGQVPTYFFTLMMHLAFASAIVTFFVVGLKRRMAFKNLIFVAVTANLFFIIGIKMAAMPLSNFANLYAGTVDMVIGRNELGGLILGTIATLLVIKWLGISYKIIDNYAFAIPLGLAIQRLGCLMAGCCHGIPGSMPISLQYNAGTHAYNHQLQAGLINNGALHALAVHPVQLYFIISAIITLTVVYAFRKRIKMPGNLPMLAIALLMFQRFFIEFLRDPQTNGLMGSTWGNIKMVQWLCLTIFILLISTIYLREKRRYQTSTKKTNPTIDIKRATLLLLLLLFAVTVTFPLLSKAELVVISFLFVAAALTYSVMVMQKLMISPHKLVYLSAPMVMIIGMSQISTQPKQTKELTHKETTFSISGLTGQYINEYTNTAGDCETPPVVIRDEYKYTGMAFKTTWSGYYNNQSNNHFDIVLHPLWGTRTVFCRWCRIV